MCLKVRGPTSKTWESLRLRTSTICCLPQRHDPASTQQTNKSIIPMQRILRDQARKYAFDFRDQPLLRVKSGETFEVETWDASTGFFKSAADKAIPGKRPGFDRVPPLANPIAGPIFVEGAQRGDTLAVKIEQIQV